MLNNITVSQLLPNIDILCCHFGRSRGVCSILNTSVSESNIFYNYYFYSILRWFVYRSMVPDVVDAALLETGIRREELFYAFFVFGNKFSAGVTLGISTGIYK